jgi:dTMP kinase
MLITFEGIDCCGKSTQIKLLCEYFEKMKVDYILLREPGNTPISEQIREMLLQKKYMDMSSLTELLLFSASRAQLVEKIISPALKDNKIVICDRFYDSTVAYQGYGRGIKLDDINNINRISTNGLIPDKTFLINISVETSIKRSEIRKGESPDRMELSGIEFFNKVANGYLEIAINNPKRFIVIDGEPDPEIVFNHLVKHI